MFVNTLMTPKHRPRRAALLCILLAIATTSLADEGPNIPLRVAPSDPSATGTLADEGPNIPNKEINYPGFISTALKVEAIREEHRVTEAQFIKMASEPNTMILDARSPDKFAMVHVQGAKHFALTDFTAADLAKIIPDKTERILIYCNNNFLNEPVAFASKAPVASLNLYTFNSLYAYGYTNVFELGPLIDIKKSNLPFEGTRVTLKAD